MSAFIFFICKSNMELGKHFGPKEGKRYFRTREQGDFLIVFHGLFLFALTKNTAADENSHDIVFVIFIVRFTAG